ncbi:Zinc transporter ZIP2 [Strongyloides ratti]|uniref:Zinc transporter ZIP2 n=1 Tax=Strongyloides ratti TaxID=34506 RepID=A0A090L9H0_STRRB|nr:Zinc transporter ZIP2 [Strongyloides ratti]CEF66436.1 Zinc transporter ZIP2 [Strongyloides ratti]
MEHDHHVEDNLLIWRIILLTIMVVMTFSIGILPVKILKFLRKRAAENRSRQQGSSRFSSLSLCMLTCFSGGVFLATCFLHLLPELNDHIKHVVVEHDFHIDYPLAELLTCIGFFFLFFIEELVLKFIPAAGHGHSHSQPIEKSLLKVSENELETSSFIDTKSHPYLEKGNKNGKNHLLNIGDEKKKDVEKIQAISQMTKGNDDNDNFSCKSLAFAEPERCETDCHKIDEHPPIRMKSHPHRHSHGVRSVTFLLAISSHSVIEGLAFGAMNTKKGLRALFISLMIHKLIVAFSMGLQLARTHAHNIKWVIVSMFIFSITSPVGAIVGSFVHNIENEYLKDILLMIMQGLAVGTFLYVTFFEVLINERNNEHNNFLKLALIVFGFSVIGTLRYFDQHEHNHSHDNKMSMHSHDH